MGRWECDMWRKMGMSERKNTPPLGEEGGHDAVAEELDLKGVRGGGGLGGGLVVRGWAA